MNLIPTLRYLILTLQHKWYVFLAGLRLKVPLWRLITHDLSKLSWAELPHYGRQFFGAKDDPEGFIRTWVHHQNHNDHHWEYWVPRTGHNRCTPPYPDNQPIPMPEEAVLEMVADWMGACRAYEGHWPKVADWEWLKKNFPDKMNLNVHTEILIRWTLGRLAKQQMFQNVLENWDELEAKDGF